MDQPGRAAVNQPPGDRRQQRGDQERTGEGAGKLGLGPAQIPLPIRQERREDVVHRCPDHQLRHGQGQDVDPQ